MPLFRRRKAGGVEPQCRFLVHVRALPSLPGGDALELDEPHTVTSPSGAAFETRAFRDTRPADERAPDDELQALGGLDDDGVQRLKDAEFAVAIELRTAGRSPNEDVVFATELADQLAREGEGIVRDMEAQRLFRPGGWHVEDRLGDPDPREHVMIHVVTDDGTAWIHTHGLVKFGRAEVEAYDVPDDLRQPVAIGMLDIAAYLLSGAVIEAGHTLGDPSLPIEVREGGRDREHWEDTPVLELVGEDGMRTWFAS